MKKSEIRKQILKIRKSKNRNNFKINFNNIINLLKKENITGKTVGGYYPYNFEADAIMADRETQFDIWRFEKSIKPKKVLIIVDQAFPIHKKIEKVFNEIIFLEEFPVVKGKHVLNIYKVYLAKV